MLDEDGSFTAAAVPHVLVSIGILKPVQPLTTQIIGQGSAFLQDVTPKTKAAYLTMLSSRQFFEKSGRWLSTQEAERVLQAIALFEPTEEEQLEVLNPDF